MTGLTSVKLPLKLAQSSGIDSGAFNGCDKLNTIEFDFTTTNLTNTLDNLDANAVTQLTNIYKMFAASDDSFRDNTQIGQGDKAPAKTTWWLPQNIGGNDASNQGPKFNHKTGDDTPANFTSTLNGIK